MARTGFINPSCHREDAKSRKDAKRFSSSFLCAFADLLRLCGDEAIRKTAFRRSGVILSLVERGWQAAREASLEAGSRGDRVLHVIKGHVSPSVLALIAPHPCIRVVSVGRLLFWPLVWGIVVTSWPFGWLKTVWVDNDRSYRRLARWTRASHVAMANVQPGPAGYELCQ